MKSLHLKKNISDGPNGTNENCPRPMNVYQAALRSRGNQGHFNRLVNGNSCIVESTETKDLDVIMYVYGGLKTGMIHFIMPVTRATACSCKQRKEETITRESLVGADASDILSTSPTPEES